LGRKRGSWGEAACAFFYPTGNRHPRDACHAGNAALRVALAQQLVHLRILHRFGHGGRREAGLVPAALALVFGMAPSAAIAANVFTAASGAEVLRKNHPANLAFHLELSHRRIFFNEQLTMSNEQFRPAEFGLYSIIHCSLLIAH
jgi:hypothetical protein